MVQEEKIASFYYAQYKENAIHKGKNRGRNGNKSGRLDICRKQCTMLGRELNGLTYPCQGSKAGRFSPAD